MISVCGLWVVSMFVVGVSARRECSQQQNANMQVKFNECATKLDHAHFEARDSIDTPEDLEAATCKLLSETIEDCGKVWKQCHGEEDIRVMKDMYINQLVAHYGQDGVEVNTCQIVKEFRESGRHTDESGSQDLCNGDKTNEMTRKFQDCSHSTSSSAYQVVMDIIDPTSITDTLCKSLTTIGTVCAKTLKECYNKEDLERTTNDHLKEMKSFFMQIVEGKVKNDSLNNCPILKAIHGSIEEEEEEFEDYDKTNDINGNQPVTVDNQHQETTRANLEKVESTKEDIVQTSEEENENLNVPEVNRVPPKEEQTTAFTTVKVETNSTKEDTDTIIPKVDEETPQKPENSSFQYTVREIPVTQQQTRNNSSALNSVLSRDMIAITLVVSLLWRYNI